MILIIDNFDSFTHLIAQYFGAAGADVRAIHFYKEAVFCGAVIASAVQ